MVDKNISATTKFAEGFLNGNRFALVHSILLAPFFAKERSLEINKPFWSQYLIHCSKAFVLYSCILGSTFGMR